MTPRPTDSRQSRRGFLTTTGAIGAALAGGWPGPTARASDARGQWTRLSEHLLVFHGAVNVGVLREGNKALLIDCGDGRVADALEQIGIASVDQILFTHHHRDQACGAHRFTERGARVGVPADERGYFDDVAAYWTDPKSRWHLYYQRPHHLMLAEPIRVDATLGDGQELRWGPATIRVLSTPGHTDGAVSFAVEVDGRQTVFCGDCLYDEGQVWDLYSLQKGGQFGQRRITDYHGFLGARTELAAGLARIQAAAPDTLVPSHGRIVSDPPRAIDALVARLDACYDKYVAISALRHYFPQMFREFADRDDHMPIRPGNAVPDCLRHFGTTWMLVSEDRAAYAMDCGNARVVEWLKTLVESGEIRGVEGLWVTHYHDDHVDAIPQFQQAFDCPCVTDEHVAEVIGDPLAWRLPCISPSVARVDRPTRDGESWRWREFRLTAYHLPGQTYYHAGLFVEGRGLRMLFAGDSFTMAGIDDYCAHNRNWLGPGVGFDRCIALIEKLQPTHVFNCHVNDAFDFTPEQCRFMRENLAEREGLYGRLVPWDHANYGMDEPWVRCFPYEQKASPGDRVELRVVVTNHSTEPRSAACRPALPRAWNAATGDAEWSRVEIAPKSEGEVRVAFDVPRRVEPGRYVVPVDLRYGPWDLPQFQEAIVVI